MDNDRNGNMDDLNRDGRVDATDAKVIGDAAERVEAKYPALVGGIGDLPRVLRPWALHPHRHPRVPRPLERSQRRVDDAKEEL